MAQPVTLLQTLGVMMHFRQYLIFPPFTYGIKALAHRWKKCYTWRSTVSMFFSLLIDQPSYT